MSKKNLRVSGNWSRSRYTLPIVAVGILILMALIIWGTNNANTVDPDANNPNVLTISTGTQGRIDGLDIGLGDINGNSAFIYLHQGSTSDSITKKVVAGDELEVYGYKINVKSIKAPWNPSTLIGASHGNIKLLVVKQ